MANELLVPPLGENVTAGDVTRILVKAGDRITADQAILELETGKATVEVPSPTAGIVGEILVKEGDRVSVGQAVARLSGAAAPAAQVTNPTPVNPGPAPAGPTPVPKPAPTPAPVRPTAKSPTSSAVVRNRLKIPSLGENVQAGDITRIIVKIGEQISQDQSVLEMETGKATVEVPSPGEGRVLEVLVKEGQRVSVGDDFMVVEGPAPVNQASAQVEYLPVEDANLPPPAFTVFPPDPRPAPVEPKIELRDDSLAAGPAVRKFARELGIDVSGLRGTGPEGRITIDDVKAAAKNKIAPAPGAEDMASSSGLIPGKPLPDFAKYGGIRREKMNAIRRVTSEHMAYCWQTVPHVTQHDKADITELEKLRKRFARKAEEAGGKLTPTAILLKMAASALKVFPDFCASIDTVAGEIIYKNYINIGVAVDTPKGLLVPVIRDVDRKNIVELAVELSAIAVKAREGKISPSDLQGGCFTISNIGGIGGSFFTPIVNHPEVAILGIGRGTVEAIYNGTAFEPRLMLPLSLSYDHRLIDGAQGARFLHWFCEAITEPILLAMEG